MERSRKETVSSANKFWRLEKRYGIPVWKNLLALPHSGQAHSPFQQKLEQELRFTFTQTNESNHLAQADVFVSEKTNFVNLCRHLPFLFDRYRIFLCADHLIQERIYSLRQEVLFEGDNQATNNLHFLLESAARSDASDIHIESLASGKRVRMRINGKLRKIGLPEAIDESLFLKIKLHAGMDIAQKRIPQDGHFPFISSRGQRFDLRISTVPGVEGEKIVIRLLPSTSVQFTLAEMGFADFHINIIKRNLVSKTGMILFTGPTGSGKTTSLYAILRELLTESLNIITIEDPVEYRLNGITQVEVNEIAGLTFSSALRSFLRQDPDVILVGEIRDQETAQIAARAAQTGHLVLSTLHSNNVFEAVHRLRGLGVDRDDISSSLKLLISQRLVSQKCHCQRQKECPECKGTGIKGRVPVMEILEIDAGIRRLLAFGKPLSEIEALAVRNGFVSLKQSLEQLVADSRVSPAALAFVS